MIRVALVVDDSMLIRYTVCRFLEERGLEVHSASNGLEALEQLKTIKPDLIVTDLSMPKLTGTELITEIKKRADLQHVPIIVLAARRTASDPMQMDSRAVAIVHKDIDIHEQLSTVLDSLCATKS